MGPVKSHTVVGMKLQCFLNLGHGNVRLVFDSGRTGRSHDAFSYPFISSAERISTNKMTRSHVTPFALGTGCLCGRSLDCDPNDVSRRLQTGLVILTK